MRSENIGPLDPELAEEARRFEQMQNQPRRPLTLRDRRRADAVSGVLTPNAIGHLYARDRVDAEERDHLLDLAVRAEDRKSRPRGGRR